MLIRQKKLDEIENRLLGLEDCYNGLSKKHEATEKELSDTKKELLEAKMELENAKNQIAVLLQRNQPQKKEEKPDIAGSFPNFKPKHMFCPNEDYKGGN